MIQVILLSFNSFSTSILILNQIWEDVSMDFIEALPKLISFDSIMIVVNCVNTIITLLSYTPTQQKI